MTELIRAASLTAFPEIARSVGLKPEALLQEAGIDRRALDDPDMRISVRAVGHLLELAARQSQVDTFGLRIGETRSVAILGPIGLLLREEPTVRDALKSLTKYLFLHNETLVLRLDEVEGHGGIGRGAERDLGVLDREGDAVSQSLAEHRQESPDLFGFACLQDKRADLALVFVGIGEVDRRPGCELMIERVRHRQVLLDQPRAQPEPD